MQMQMPSLSKLAVTTLLAAGSLIFGENLKPADVKVFGALDYGDTSEAIEYTGSPRFGAFIFNGTGKDQVEITVEGAERQAFVAIADGSLKELASGTAKLSFTLPDHGSDPEAYYILFRELEGKPARFTVTVKKLPMRRAVVRGISGNPLCSFSPQS